MLPQRGPGTHCNTPSCEATQRPPDLPGARETGQTGPLCLGSPARRNERGSAGTATDGTMGHRKAFQDSQEHSAPHRGIRGHRSRATSHTCPDALGKEKPEERGRNGHGSWRAGRPGLRCQTAVPPGLHNCDNGKLRHFKRSFHFLTSLRQSGLPSGHQDHEDARSTPASGPGPSGGAQAGLIQYSHLGDGDTHSASPDPAPGG